MAAIEKGPQTPKNIPPDINGKLIEGRNRLKKAGLIVPGIWEKALIEFEMAQITRMDNKGPKNKDIVEEAGVEIYRKQDDKKAENMPIIRNKQPKRTSGGLADKLPDGY